MKKNGFTLVELMVVVAVVGVLAAISLPAYQDNLIRSRVSEGIVLSEEAKIEVASHGTTSAMDLRIAADSWNSRMSGAGSRSKYVNSIRIDEISGEIEIEFTANTFAGAAGRTLIISPQMRFGSGLPATALPVYFSSSQSSGTLDWLCTSSAGSGVGTRANQYLFTAPIAIATLPAKYAPAECR